MLKPNAKIAVVIPCYKVKEHILSVIATIGNECQRIYVVDDCCPEQSGSHVSAHCQDPRVKVLTHIENQGVGGAMVTGYQAALDEQMDVVVKIDGDGQMDPKLLPIFVAPILDGEADYCKGNRFYYLDSLRAMPAIRIFGNAILSFMTKLSSGYWDLFDPTNGYTAVHCQVLRQLPLAKLSRRYFFESDMLFRLNIVRAVVVDIPMHAHYGAEVSNLHIRRIIGEFLRKHSSNFSKRIFYNYFLRDMALASIELPAGVLLLLFSLVFGGYHWYASAISGIPATVGTVMLSAFSLLVGIQLILSFVAYDIANTPKRVLHKRLQRVQPS
jgi:dolichol-phosphate mannosyltransferase